MSESNDKAAVDQSAGHHDASHDAEHFNSHAKLYRNVGIALMVLTFVTVAVSYIPFPTVELHIGMGLLVAIIKAALVVLYFMHMKEEKGVIYQVMALSVIFVVVLFALCVLAIKDPIVM